MIKAVEKNMNEGINACGYGYMPILKLFDVDLSIPIYQRPYSWEQTQVQTLLEDLYKAFEKEQSKYLVGNIILYKNDNKVNYEIVDGQQRTITFSLIFSNLNKETTFFSSTEISVLSAKALKDNNKLIKNFLSALGENEKEEFRNYISNNIIVTYTVADTLDKAFFYFDSQNTRGKSLARKDLLKVHHYREFPQNTEALQKTILKQWEKIEYQEDDKQIDMIEVLMRDYLGIVRKGVRNELTGSNALRWLDVFEEFQSEGKSTKLNNYNQPPLFEKFQYDFEKDFITFIPKKLSCDRSYGIDDGMKYLPFELTQSIDGGENFFYYIFKYHVLQQKLETMHCYSMFNEVSGAGNSYLIKVYKSALIFYYDKFEDEQFEGFAYTLYFMLAYFRVSNGHVNARGVAKFGWIEGISFNPFREIYLKYSPTHILESMQKYIKFQFHKENFQKEIEDVKKTAKNFFNKANEEKAKCYFRKIRKDWVWEHLK